jgi:HEAT repeat protein
MIPGRTALLLLVLGLGTACGDPGEEVAGTSATIHAAIREFDTSPAAGSASRSKLLHALVSDSAATREAARELIGSKEPDVRIAAVYALSVTAQRADADALSPLLESRDAGERVLAAAGMLAIADRRAVPVLIAALGDDTALPFGSPPARVWEKARYALLQSTGQDFGLRGAATAAEAAATMPAWEAWWADAEASFAVVPIPDPFGS